MYCLSQCGQYSVDTVLWQVSVMGNHWQLADKVNRYETDFTAKSFEETLNGSKAMLMATGGMTEEKGKLFDESQRLLAEYMGNGGLISYKNVVVVARKVD